MKNADKIDAIVNRMQQNNIDIYLVQETWLEGKDEFSKQLEIDNILVLLHGNKQQTCARGRGGVAIFLGPRAQQAWKAAGSKPPQIKIIPNDVAQIIGIKLRIPQPRGHCNIFVCSVYHPDASKGTTTIDNFYNSLNEFLDNIPTNNNIIIGADTNTPLGTSLNKNDLNHRYIGKYGLKYHRNDQNYHELTAILRKFELRATNTDFISKKYDTWTGPFNSPFGGSFQLDYLMVSNKIRKHVTKSRTSYLGVESDHFAIKLTLRFHSTKKHRTTHEQRKPRIDWKELNDTTKAKKIQR
jgi:exonuclease III